MPKRPKAEYHQAKASSQEKARLAIALRAKAEDIVKRTEQKRAEAKQTAHELRRTRTVA